MKRVGGFVLVVMGVLILCVVTLSNLGTRSDMVSGITGDKIKQVRLGMSYEEVVQFIGVPYEIHTLMGLHHIDCKTSPPLPIIYPSVKTNVRTAVD